MDPHNPRILYAAVWQAQRTPWGMSSGGPDSSLWKSTDGGDTWTDISRNPGCRAACWGGSASPCRRPTAGASTP